MPSQNVISTQADVAVPFCDLYGFPLKYFVLKKALIVADLAIIQEIIALATVSVANQPFRAIWRAYDAVLAARHIDPSLDSVYFRLILQMQGAAGHTLEEKLRSTLDKLSVSHKVTNINDTDTASTIDSHTEPFDDSGMQQTKYRRPENDNTIYHLDNQPELYTHRVTSYDGKITNDLPRHIRTSSKIRTNNVPECSNSVQPRVPEDVADHLYKLRLRSMVRRYFLRWHAATVCSVENHWFAAVGQRVEDRYYRKLLLRIWCIWIRRTATVVQSAQDVRLQVLGYKYFHVWQDVILSSEERMRVFQTSNVFARWRDQLCARRTLITRSLEFYDQNLLHRAYWVWFFKLCGILAPKKYNGLLIQKFFRLWIDRQNKIVRHRQKAKRLCCMRLLGVSFSHWSYRAEEVFGQDSLAVNYYKSHSLKTSFQCWKRGAMMRPLSSAIREYTGDRILYDSFINWRKRAKHGKLSSQMYKDITMRRVLRTWRLKLRQAIVVECRDSLIKFRTLQLWVRLERYFLMARVVERRLGRAIICLVVRNIHIRQRRLKQLSQTLENQRKTKLIQTVLSCWLNQIEQMSSLDSRSKTYHDLYLTKRMFLAWWRQCIASKTRYQWADDASYYFTAKQAMKLFRCSYEEARKRRLRNTYVKVSRNTKIHLALNVLYAWRSKRHNRLVVSNIGITFRELKNKQLLVTHFSHWQSRIHLCNGSYEEAQEIDRRRLISQGFGIWYNKNLLLKHIHELATNSQKDLNLQLAGTCLRRLQTRLWDLTMLHEKGDKLYKRNQGTKKRFVFRLWRRQLSCHTLQDRECRVVDGLSTNRIKTIGKSMITARTPVIGFRTPNWKTTGQRRYVPMSGVNLGRHLGARTPNESLPESPLKRFTAFAKSTLGHVEPENEDDLNGTLLGSYTK